MESRRLTVELGLPGGIVRVEMVVPMGEVPMERLLPALRTTADAFVAYGAEMSVTAGKPVSCAKGCGACCRQLVPIAHAEARQLAALVEELPEPRRSDREGAVRRGPPPGRGGGTPSLARWDGPGGWPPRRSTSAWTISVSASPVRSSRTRAARSTTIGPSPAGSTSSRRPPHAAAAPTAETIETVPLPTRVWAAVAREENGIPNSDPASCVPLVMAPAWAARNPEPGTPRPGPEILQKVFARFSRDRRGEGFGR